MTDRKTASTINDTELDQLYADLGRLQIANRALNTAALEAVERAERAEAGIARVREVADRWKRYGTSDLQRYADILLAALDEPAPTAATDAPDTITDPAWLREQYAVVIRRWWDADDNGAAEIAEAVLAVRDRHLDQLRQRLQVADGLHQEQLAAKDQPDA